MVAKTIYGVFIVAEKCLRIFVRLDLIGKLRSEAALQVRMAWTVVTIVTVLTVFTVRTVLTVLTVVTKKY